MSRSEEFAAGGANHHPNVRDYRSDAPGGIGSVKGSVVGMVPTHVLARYRHHEGNVDPGGDQERVMHGIVEDIKSGHGIEEPVVLEYDPKTNWAYLGEGNHRLRAAEIAGAPEVPVRVERSHWGPPGVREIEGRGAPAFHRPDVELGHGHVPASLHPSMLQFGETHESRPVHEEIHDLLQPNWGQR